MSDIADISSNAIIRPGLPAKWRWFPGDWDPFNSAARNHLRPFGKIELMENKSAECCGALVVPNRELRLWRLVMWDSTWFHERDGTEANVFVFDPYAFVWYRRNAEWIAARANIYGFSR